MTRKVVVVDDSRTARQMVKAALAEAGYDIVEASDGVEGMRQLELHGDASLVLCDVNMPNMNGIEMLEAATRAAGVARHTFVMLTTEAEPDLVQRAKACGARGWIVKPFRAEMLLAAVRKIVGDA